MQISRNIIIFFFEKKSIQGKKWLKEVKNFQKYIFQLKLFLFVFSFKEK